MPQNKRKMFSCWVQVEFFDFIEANKSLYGGSQGSVIEEALNNMAPAHFAKLGVIPGKRFEHKFGGGKDGGK